MKVLNSVNCKKHGEQPPFRITVKQAGFLVDYAYCPVCVCSVLAIYVEPTLAEFTDKWDLLPNSDNKRG